MKRIGKIGVQIGLVLVLVLVSSLAFSTAVQAAFVPPGPGNMQWRVQPLPPGINQITSGPSLTPDGNTIFMPTFEPPNITLWKSPTPISNTSWSVNFTAPAAPGSNGGMIFLSPDYATFPTLCFFDRAPGGPIYRSSDGGTSWTTLSAPTAGFFIQNATFQDHNIGYITDGAGNIYKTINGCSTWTGPVNAGVGPVRSLVVGEPNNLIVGGTGYIAYSNDGGATFTTIVGNTGETYRIVRDPNFAVNKTIYLADSVFGRTYRLVIGTDSTPIDLLAPSSGTPVVALLCRSGALYSVHPTLADRTLQPLGTPGTLNWRTMDSYGSTPILPSPGISAATADVNNIVYARCSIPGSPQLWAYRDYLATQTSSLLSPPNNDTIPIDPVTGRAETVTLTFAPVGSGTGQANAYEVQIAELGSWGWSAPTSSGVINVFAPTTPAVTMGPGGQFVYTMAAGKKYQWRVRAANEVSGDQIDSPWSAPFIIKAHN